LLVESEPLWKRTNDKIYGELGIKLSLQDTYDMRGKTVIENLEHFYTTHPWKGPSVKEVEQKVIREMVHLIKAEIMLKPGVHHTLQICKQAGLPIAIASSSFQPIIDAVVDTLEIREHFHHIYSAQFEPFGKPHPGVFISVAQHFKVPAAQCLVFEDAPAGVLAAKAAKMKCVAVPVPELRENAFIKTADSILDSLEQFTVQMLKSL